MAIINRFYKLEMWQLGVVQKSWQRVTWLTFLKLKMFKYVKWHKVLKLFMNVVFHHQSSSGLISCWFWKYGRQPELPDPAPKTSSCPTDPCSHQQHLRAISAHHSPRLNTLSKGAVAANWILLWSIKFSHQCSVHAPVVNMLMWNRTACETSLTLICWRKKLKLQQRQTCLIPLLIKFCLKIYQK